MATNEQPDATRRPKKQEQEPARNEISEVAPGILRMELPIRIPGLAHVNCYALLDENGAAVVDPGLPGPATWRAIKDRLRQAHLRVRDVHTVIVTHSHPDHFGCATHFAVKAGAKVVAHDSFSFLPYGQTREPEISLNDFGHEGCHPDSSEPEGTPDGNGESPAKALAPVPTGRTPWGSVEVRSPLRIRLKWQLMRLLARRSFVPTITRPVVDGQRLRLARREWTVVHTPGHTGDHICLHDPETGTFLAGDHVLPTITPHISGLTPAADPLLAFFQSLDRVAAIDGVRTVLPAHGHPFESLSARSAAIKQHHFERLDEVKAIARDLGPATVEAFSQRLFRERHWGWMAESETFAHLEHLRHAREAECHRAKDGTLIYSTG